MNMNEYLYMKACWGVGGRIDDWAPPHFAHLAIILHDHFFPQTLADFEEEYSRRATEGNFDTVDVRFRIYDALWALAMALNDTMTMVNNSDIDETGCQAMNGSMVPLEDFTYDNAQMGCLIQWNLQKINFFGVSV